MNDKTKQKLARYGLGVLVAWAGGYWTHRLMFPNPKLLESGIAGGIGIALYGMLELFREEEPENESSAS